ncbi:MAG TPA: GFA family protein [Polyangia bacterium]|nr:GFA family protein [Polyangia bacterium]
MSEPQTHSGGCQCGLVRYEVRVDLSQPVMACNCSMCGRAGTLLTFVPANQFTLKSGGEGLTDYQFNKHVIHHLFCSRCGIKSFARGVGRDGSEQVAVNVRCLDGVDVEKLNVQRFDGRAR